MLVYILFSVLWSLFWRDGGLSVAGVVIVGMVPVVLLIRGGRPKEVRRRGITNVERDALL